MNETSALKTDVSLNAFCLLKCFSAFRTISDLLRNKCQYATEIEI